MANCHSNEEWQLEETCLEIILSTPFSLRPMYLASPEVLFSRYLFLLFVHVCCLFDWAVFLRAFLLSCLIDELEASFLQFSVSRAATCAKVLLVFAFASKSWGIKGTKWFGVQPLRSVYWMCVHTMTACEEQRFFAGWLLIFMQLWSIREPWTQGYTDVMGNPVALHRTNMCHIFEYLDGLIVSVPPAFKASLQRYIRWCIKTAITEFLNATINPTLWTLPGSHHSNIEICWDRAKNR